MYKGFVHEKLKLLKFLWDSILTKLLRSYNKQQMAEGDCRRRGKTMS